MTRRTGFTLIEILVSLTITLMMMGAVVALFGVMTDSVSGSRAVIEMSERLRACRNRLQADLVGATATMQPPLRPENDEGYFELIEGPFTDADSLVASGVQPNYCSVGDCDDVLVFTTRTRAEPFVGRFNTTGTYESQIAEVMYFAIPNGPTLDPASGVRLYTLYRRVLLVAPALRNNPNFPTTLSGATANFYDNFDISSHVEVSGVSGTLVPNTLGDLTKRENRFAHYPNSGAVAGFPFDLNQTIPASPAGRPNVDASLMPFSITGGRIGDDVLMTNVVAFDVQVYDPNSPVQLSSTGIALSQPDKGFSTSASPSQYGAYVNLGYTYPTPAAAPFPVFSNVQLQTVTLSPTINLNPMLPAMALGISNPLPAPSYLSGAYTYDTWSLHYENDGLPEPSTATTFDLGTNGLDDNSNGIVDDPLEYDTRPPFPSPLRGIRVIIRA